MHIVAVNGKPEANRSHRIMGQKTVVQRIPIKKEGKVIAVFGQVMFKDVSDVGKLAKNLSLLESKVKLYEEELINLRSTKYTFDSIIGHSKTIRSLKKEFLIAATNQNLEEMVDDGLLGIHRTLLYKKMKKYSIALQPNLSVSKSIHINDCFTCSKIENHSAKRRGYPPIAPGYCAMPHESRGALWL